MILVAASISFGRREPLELGFIDEEQRLQVSAGLWPRFLVQSKTGLLEGFGPKTR